MKKTLGTVTIYHGNEHRYLRGHQVRIIAVIKNAAREDYDVDADDGYLTDEEDIARRGGVTADDRVEVQPWPSRPRSGRPPRRRPTRPSRTG
ncbi:MAG: hypothetical protein ACOC1F_05840 [Myxococcota bacterium]